MSLRIIDVANDLLSKIGIEGSDPTVAPALTQQDVIIAINGGLQILQTAGEDYFTRQKLVIGIAAGTSVYPITQAVQAVLGPIRLNDSKPLRALASRGELDQYDRIFLGSSTFGAAPGTPEAYWVENLNNGATSGDINQINIWLAPQPNATGTLAIEVVDDAPSYTVASIGSANLLPIAHNYAESILLPIARYLVTRSSQFSRLSILPQLTADYQMAMERLGLAGGFPNVTQDKPPREVKA